MYLQRLQNILINVFNDSVCNISDRDDFNINNNSIDSNEENYGGDVESQHSTTNKSGSKKMSCVKNSVTKNIPRKAGLRKTSTPAKKSLGSPVRGSKGNKSRLAKSQSSFSSVSDVFGNYNSFVLASFEDF